MLSFTVESKERFLFASYVNEIVVIIFFIGGSQFDIGDHEVVILVLSREIFTCSYLVLNHILALPCLTGINQSINKLSIINSSHELTHIIFLHLFRRKCSQEYEISNGHNKNINKMSKCHFPCDNHTVILDVPEIQQIQLRLIETHQRLPDPSFLSLSCLDLPQPSTQLLADLPLEEEDSLGAALASEELGQVKSKRKTGCTCKKTNCIKMYC